MSEPRTLCILAETPRGLRADPGPLLDPIIDNRWAPVTEMRLESQRGASWEALDRSRAVAELADGGHVTFRDRADPPSIDGQVMNLLRTSAGLYVPQARFGLGGRDDARQALARILARMPTEAPGTIVVDAVGDEQLAASWFARHAIEPIPAPLAGLPWLAALPLASYPDALAIPAVAVERRDARVWLQLYDDPFAYDTVATRERIAAISAHIRRTGWRGPIG